MMTVSDVFDIFGDIFADLQTTKSDKKEVNDGALLNNVDMKDVTKEELNETIAYLDKLKDNDFTTLLLGDEFIDKVKAELVAKWDIAHEKDEKPAEEESAIDKRIKELVDEYVDSMNLPDTELMNICAGISKEAYIQFAKFIYNHK